jgi:hypothetical protein
MTRTRSQRVGGTMHGGAASSSGAPGRRTLTGQIQRQARSTTSAQAPATSGEPAAQVTGEADLLTWLTMAPTEPTAIRTRLTYIAGRLHGQDAATKKALIARFIAKVPRASDLLAMAFKTKLTRGERAWMLRVLRGWDPPGDLPAKLEPKSPEKPAAEPAPEKRGGIPTTVGGFLRLGAETIVDGIGDLAGKSVDRADPSGLGRRAGKAAVDAFTDARFNFGFLKGFPAGIEDAALDMVKDVADSALLQLKIYKALISGELVALAKEMHGEIADLVDGASGLAEEFLAKWNANGSYARGRFRGHTIAYLIVVLAVTVYAGPEAALMRVRAELQAVVRMARRLRAASLEEVSLAKLSSVERQLKELRAGERRISSTKTGTADRTRAGIKRANRKEWREIVKTWDAAGYGGALSPQNRMLIKQGKVPRVDGAWVEWFPGDAGLIGEKINIHHIGGGKLTVPLPKSRHMDAHMPGGTKENPGGPGRTGAIEREDDGLRFA